jgi:hypothetical protein
MSLIIPANTLASGGYAVDNSLRFNRGSSDHLTFTPSSTGNRRTFTISFWIKISEQNTGSLEYGIFDAGGDADVSGWFDIQQGHTAAGDFMSQFYNGAFRNFKLTQKIQDQSAWYHFVVAIDSTQGTDTNRIKYYINGTQVTQFSSPIYPSQNFDFNVNTSGQKQTIGGRANTSATIVNFFDGYLSEFVMIDGSQLDPTSFGEFDSDSGIWKPIDVSGLTFGTNGFYLDFEDSAALGDDVSGNGNDFTVNNLTAIDQTTDTCTNNFATANPLVNTTPTYSDGNLTIVTTNGNNLGGVSTIGVNTGKWYAEFKVIANDTCAMLGIDSNPSESARLDASGEAFPGKYVTGYGYLFNGYIFNLGGLGEITYGDTFTTNDIIGIALDLDNNKLYFSKNGTFQNSGDPTSGATGTGAISITDPSSQPTGNYFFVTADGSRARASTFSCNFGNPAFTISSGNTDGNGYGNFEYAPPSGYLSLCTANLSEVLG